jgi:hypothetical protein
MAFNLFIANVVLGVLGVILSFSLVGAIVEAQLAASGLSRADLGPQGEAALTSGLIVGVVVSLVILALYLFFIFQMRAGKNWARIVLAVLGAISVVFGLIGFSGYGVYMQAGGIGVIVVILSILQLILIIAAIVFMFRPDANAYFTAPRA